MNMTKSKTRFFFMEAAGLAGFVIGAGLLTILLEHPDLPVMQSGWIVHPLLRRIPLGIIMGGYIFFITLLIGKKSGAHINPAATWAFYRLKKLSLKNAVVYTIVQFAGAIVAAQILKLSVGHWFSHPLINYGVTAPKPQYTSLTAFVAEFLISFLLLFIILLASSSKRWEKGVPLLSGVLIAAYLIFELPYSGMSLNPARSTAAAIAAGKFEHLWIYFVSPLSAMLLAAELFLRIDKGRHGTDRKELPFYPMEEPV